MVIPDFPDSLLEFYKAGEIEHFISHYRANNYSGSRWSHDRGIEVVFRVHFETDRGSHYFMPEVHRWRQLKLNGKKMRLWLCSGEEIVVAEGYVTRYEGSWRHHSDEKLQQVMSSLKENAQKREHSWVPYSVNAGVTLLNPKDTPPDAREADHSFRLVSRLPSAMHFERSDYEDFSWVSRADCGFSHGSAADDYHEGCRGLEDSLEPDW